jgi:hypothetical protein
MKILKLFLKHPQIVDHTGYELDALTGKESRTTEATKKEIFKLIKEARVVAIEGSLLEKTLRSNGVPGFNIDKGEIPKSLQELGADRTMVRGNNTLQELVNRPLSPPFKLTWFELYSSSGIGTIPFHFYETMMGSGKKVPVASVGMLVHETSPGVFDFFCLEADSYEDKGTVGWNITVMRNVGSQYTPNADMVCQISLRNWLKAMELGRYGMENTEETILIPRGEGNKGKVKPHVIRQIIRIVPKAKKDIEPMTSKGVIDWSHRWEVAGHWRKIDGIGKNREGEYVEEGWTWVRDFVKGPEDKELVKKTRVFVGEQNEKEESN